MTDNKYFRLVLRCSLICILVVINILVISPLFVKGVLFQMPEPSIIFDCDDSTLLMYHILDQLGITATPILGNLKVDNESYSESDHMWLIADFMGFSIPFDWGTPHFEKQYYEGYPQDYTDLLFFVEQDWINPADMSPSSYNF